MNRKDVLATLLRLSLLVALAASVTLVIEYIHVGDPAFCAVGSGCMAVRLSPYSSVGGVPLAHIGALAFSSLLGLTLFARSRLHYKIIAGLAGAGGLVACGLLLLQGFAIGAFCKFCVAADLGTITAGVTSLLLYREVRRSAEDEAAVQAYARHVNLGVTWALAAAAVIVAPVVWAQYPETPPLPPEIKALQVPGKLTMVIFSDFECPFCRALHRLVHELETREHDRIAVVPKMMPLPAHRGALPAAIAYECAPADRREELADALYEVAPSKLAPDAILQLAESLHIDTTAMKPCMDGDEGEKRVQPDKDLFKRIEGKALPLAFVGDRVILGFNPDRTLDAIRVGLGAPRPSLPVNAMYALLGVVFAATAWLSLRFMKAARRTA